MLLKRSHQVIWFTGLSGSGKSTLSQALASALKAGGHPTVVLDGDQLREGVCADLGFSSKDRAENVRRTAHMAQLLRDHAIVLVALITPVESLRELARTIIPDLKEVFVDTPLWICERRDPKGLYKKARSGLLPDFTGIDAPFEPPRKAGVVCHTEATGVAANVAQLLSHFFTHRLEGDRSRRPTIAVDFDGVIAEYDGWIDEQTLGNPRLDVKAALLSLRLEGWKIVVHTTRAAAHIEDYLRASGVPYDEINSNSDYSNGGVKPVATVYWDDRALRYSGDAAMDLPLIRNFTTWSHRK